MRSRKLVLCLKKTASNWRGASGEGQLCEVTRAKYGRFMHPSRDPRPEAGDAPGTVVDNGGSWFAIASRGVVTKTEILIFLDMFYDMDGRMFC